MNNSMKIICAIFGGQVAQVLISVVAKSLYIERAILWSSAVGFLSIFLILVGVVIRDMDAVNARKRH